jgi:ferredoxin-type protein NapH
MRPRCPRNSCRPPSRLDYAALSAAGRPAPPAGSLVPWLAAGTLVLLIALIGVREAGDLIGRPLAPKTGAAMGQSVWWIYWGSVLFFGCVAIRRWRNTYFRWRTVATMVSQTLFGLLLAGPLKVYLGIPPFWQRLHLTWPLHMSVMSPWLEKSLLAGFVYGLVMSLVVWPGIARWLGMRYCSWFCFCGNLAESLGDPFRTKGPKGPSRQSFDSMGYVVLGLAALATGGLWLGIAWPLRWYDALVGFVLADLVGIAAYPFLGSRVWCRFLCPLRAMLGWHSRRGRFAIYTSSHRCIECGTCNRYCEMGIDIRQRAREGLPLQDTECVACGGCIAVCPRYALSFHAFPTPEEAARATAVRRLRRPFRRQLATPRGR